MPCTATDSEMRAEPPSSEGAAEFSTSGIGLSLREGEGVAVSLREGDAVADSDGEDECVTLDVPVDVPDCMGRETREQR